MPSTYAHRRFGANVLEHLPTEIQNQITPYRELYDMGLHGPDLLFYYHAASSNKVGQLGNAMHEEPGEVFFAPAREVIRKTEDRGAALAYVLGYICHFALDSTCHPYVEQYVRSSGVSHCEIETEFDNMLMRRDGYDPLHFFTASHIHPSMERAKVVAPFYKDLTVEEVYGTSAAAGLQPGETLGGADRDAGRGQVRHPARAGGKPEAQPRLHREQPETGSAVRRGSASGRAADPGI